ncbi:hypothetical protein BKA69DRAFT_1121353 [Paraphysoderma sedebokerense]|nr:hypothetical protein BKA69DRAFT_1121353 [Paraphysoderma sedebokerense]
MALSYAEESISLHNLASPQAQSRQGSEHIENARDKRPLAANIKALYKQVIPTLYLKNEGSVARDHLANERTFLAWVRSSLGAVVVGIAVVQIFRVSRDEQNAARYGKPLGATFIAIGILFLLIAIMRYFQVQKWLIEGQFPATRWDVILTTVATVSIVVAVLVVTLVI